MSLSDTKEKSNGSKLSRLLIDGGTKVLRCTFDGFHPPATLSGTLNLKRGVLTSLRGRVLNNCQWDKLFPPGGVPPDSTKFDITLLFILLRNICGLSPPSTGWNTLPPTTDTTLEANLARIKYFRNEVYGHISSTSIKDSKFESLWRDISSPLVALGLDQNEVDSLKNEMTSTDYIELLKEWTVQDHDLKEETLETRRVAEKSLEVAEKSSEVLQQIRLQAENTKAETLETRHVAEESLEVAEKSSEVLQQIKLQAENTKAETLETRHVAEKSLEVAEKSSEVLQQIRLQVEKTHNVFESVQADFREQRGSLVPSCDNTELTSKQKRKSPASTETLEEIPGKKLKVLLHKDTAIPEQDPQHPSPSTEGCDYTELSSKMKRKILDSTETFEEIHGKNLKTDTIFTKLLLQKGQIEHSLNFEERRKKLLSYTANVFTNEIIEQAYQLFLPDEDTENPKLILLTGRAGIGKTMFSMKLVRDWASNSLFPGGEIDNKYKFVFRFFFRQLNEIDQPLSLFDFLNLSHELDASEFDFVCKNPEQTLIVMDGLDEFKYKDHLDKLVPRQGKQSIAAICAQILNRSVLSGATVVVTSRPESKQLIKFNRKAEILGFKQKDVEEYFKRFFGSKGETANIVLRHVKENANVAGLCYVPVNCYIICTYFRWHLENQRFSTEEYKLPSTITELYAGILKMFTLKHHKLYRGQTFSDTPDVNPFLPELSKLSFELLQAKKYVFNKKDLQEAMGEEGVTKVMESGIIHSIPGCSTGPFNVETKYCFIHLTFQEFLAAHYLFEKKKGYTIIQNTIEQNLDVVIQFLSGLLKTAPPSDKPRELLSFIMEKLITSKKILLAIKCMFEFGSPSFAKQVVQQYNFTDLEFEVNDSDCAALAFLLSLDIETNHKTEFLNLSFSSITCVGMRYVRDVLKSPNCCINSLLLCSGTIDAEGTKYLSEALSSVHCKLQGLFVEVDGIGAEGTKYLSEALSSGHCTLQVLSVCARIGAEGAKYLSEALSSGHCNLQKFMVYGDIGAEGTKYLSEALSSGHCNLPKLDVSHNKIGDESAKYLSEALSSGHCTLRWLDVSVNTIGAEGAKYLSEALSSGHCTLLKLYVSENTIGDEGAKYLSEALSSCHCNLPKLDVSYNNIGAEGAKYLSEALSSGHCTLQQLNVSDNNIGDEGAKYLSEALSSDHCTLQRLNVSFNNIGAEGAKCLSEALSSGHCTVEFEKQ